MRLGAVMSKLWKTSSTTGPATLLSLSTAAVVADVGICLFSLGRPLPDCFPSLSQISHCRHFFHYNICTYSGAMYSGVSGIHPACSAPILSRACITRAVPTNLIPFGGDKQVQTVPSELAGVAHHHLLWPPRTVALPGGNNAVTV